MTVRGTGTTAGDVPAWNGSTAWVSTPNVINVMAYGTHGDGTTDDSAHIQAAIDAAGTSGGVVYFPAGKTYKLASAPVLLPAGNTRTLTLSGYGATIELTTEVPRFTSFLCPTDNLTFKKFIIEGFEIDASNVVPVHDSLQSLIGDARRIAGTGLDAVGEWYHNLEDIIVRDIYGHGLYVADQDGTWYGGIALYICR